MWQSGTRQVASKAKDTWILGTGPWQKGTIYDGTKFAGERLIAPPIPDFKKTVKKDDHNWVAQEIQFAGAAPQPLTTEAVASATPAAGDKPATPATDGKPGPAPATPASHQQTEPAKAATNPTSPGATQAPAAPTLEAPPKQLPSSVQPATPLKPGP